MYKLGLLGGYSLLSICIIIVYLVADSYIGYNASALLSIFLVYLYRGFNDLKLPFSLFNYFYVFFIFLGVASESLIRGFNNDIGFMVLISFLLFNVWNVFKQKKHTYMFKNNIRNKNVIGWFALLFSLFSIILSLLYFLKIGTIPLFTANSPEERIAAMSGNGAFLQPMRYGPISALILLIVSTGWNRKLAIMLFIISNVLILGTGFRGTFFQNIILFIIVFRFLDGSKIDFLKALKLGGGLIIGILAIGAFRGDGAIIQSFFIKIGHATSVSVYILNVVVDNYSDYKYGATFFYKFSSLLPGESIEFTQWLTTKLPMKFGGGVTPTIVGDFYINFGPFYWLGIFFLGGGVMLMENRIVQAKSNSLKLLIIVLFSLGVARSTTGGLSNTLFQTTLSIVFVFLFYVLSTLKSPKHQ